MYFWNATWVGGGLLTQKLTPRKAKLCYRETAVGAHQHWIICVTLRRLLTFCISSLLLQQHTGDNKLAERAGLFGFMVLEASVRFQSLVLEPATRQFIITVRSAWWETLFPSSPETKEKREPILHTSAEDTPPVTYNLLLDPSAWRVRHLLMVSPWQPSIKHMDCWGTLKIQVLPAVFLKEQISFPYSTWSNLYFHQNVPRRQRAWTEQTLTLFKTFPVPSAHLRAHAFQGYIQRPPEELATTKTCI